MLKKMLIESFNAWCKMRWLKMINREIRKRDKHYNQYVRYTHIATRLMNEYEKKWGNTQTTKKEGVSNAE